MYHITLLVPGLQAACTLATRPTTISPARLTTPILLLLQKLCAKVFYESLSWCLHTSFTRRANVRTTVKETQSKLRVSALRQHDIANWVRTLVNDMSYTNEESPVRGSLQNPEFSTTTSDELKESGMFCQGALLELKILKPTICALRVGRRKINLLDADHTVPGFTVRFLLTITIERETGHPHLVTLPPLRPIDLSPAL
ncbi:hypothetical protein F5888DRAFT_1637215 [Russula emetica]|nr:hypothetical protein F5888DRAFT_1637215 [Russula emetica]